MSVKLGHMQEEYFRLRDTNHFYVVLTMLEVEVDTL